MKPVAFGAMLVECLVGIMAQLLTALHPGDYYDKQYARSVPTLRDEVENLP
ncbi:hypothetical protein ACEQPO_21370 [Bacillus sp. SL00103]